MCRLLLQAGYDGSEEMMNKFKEALALMKNGGPDNTTIIERDGILFGHNRLSIIDLSDEANQPFETEKCIVLFNGEIYNHKVARVLNKLDCKTDSDTEVIAKMYEKSGMDFVKYLYGEYAIVIYDKEEKIIHYTIDPSGVKPLYDNIRGSEDRYLIISSEQKAIKYLTECPIDRGSIGGFLNYGFTRNTLHSHVCRIRPGEIAEGNIHHTYASSMRTFSPAIPHVTEVTPKMIYNVVENAVNARMLSDVPIACALSGGIDSAIVAYCMQKNSPTRIKTYTVGFKGLDNEFDEARETAKFLGTDHYEIEIDPKEIIENIDDILETMEEPVDRGSLIPTYFLAKNVKEKVILVGEGADEIFAGYKRHQADEEVSPMLTYSKYYQCFSPDEVKSEYDRSPDDMDEMDNLLTFDLKHEIPFFHCQRLDKCFMRFGIESRVPYLDQLVISTALDATMDQKKGPEKKILRQAFEGKLPDSIIYRKKRPLKLPFEYMIEMEEVKANIHNYDNPWIKKETIMAIYESLPESRNRGRKLWSIYLINKWHAKQNRSNSN